MEKINRPNILYYESMLNTPVYVDKTLLIEIMNNKIDSKQNRICVSRPRRFGKSTTLELLRDYYCNTCNSRAMFRRCKISKRDNWDRYLNSFTVFFLDTQILSYDAENYKMTLCKTIQESIYDELEDIFPDTVSIDRSKSLCENLLSVYRVTKSRYIFLVDEYDVLVREQKSDEEINEYLEFINTIANTSELQDAVALVYLTGILPMVKGDNIVKVQNFIESSIVNPDFLAKYIGFTESEVKELCTKFNKDFVRCKNFYDGYNIGNNESIYNSLEIARAMRDDRFEASWSNTGAYTSISDNLQVDINGLHKEVLNMVIYNTPISVDNIDNYLNRFDNLKTKDEILCYLIHIGYLTYDKETKTCRIPNEAIRRDWRSAVDVSPSLRKFPNYLFYNDCSFSRLLSMDEYELRSFVNRYLAPHIDKVDLDNLIDVAFVSLFWYYKEQELTSFKKNSSYKIFVPKEKYSDYPSLIFHLTKNKSEEEALKEIQEKKLIQFLSEEHKKNVCLIGINFNKTFESYYFKMEKVEE